MTASQADAFAWHDGMLVGYAPIDAAHKEFVVRVAGVLSAADAEVAAALQALAIHACEHFAAEDQWMADSNFPARECHSAEHAAVLKSVAGVQARVAAGDAAAARSLASALAEWFPGHTDYLDAALAHWMCKQQHGGKPVVVRRSLPVGPALAGA